MQPVCEAPPGPFPKRYANNYGGFKLYFWNLNLQCGSMTYTNVCSALRGVAEFMTFNNAYYALEFQIWVGGYPLGGGKIGRSGGQTEQQLTIKTEATSASVSGVLASLLPVTPTEAATS